MQKVPAMAQGEAWRIIADEWDEEDYCKNCEQYGACDMKNKPKVLICNTIAISYAKDALNGGVPFGEMDIMKRPMAMNNLVTIAYNEFQKGLKDANNK